GLNEGIPSAALARGSRKATQDGVVYRIWKRNPNARFPIAVDQNPHTPRCTRVAQKCRPGCARTDYREGLSTFGQHLCKAFRQNHAAVGGSIKPEQVLVVV